MPQSQAVQRSNSIEKVDGGYSKGYTHALTYWREIIDYLNALRNQRGMVVLLLAHSKVERFEDPESSPYDRYSPRLHKHAASLVSEWCDAVLFATRKTGVILDPQKIYAKCQHVGFGVKPITADTRVDIVKGRYFAVATEKLRPLPYLPLECDDDIILSAALGGGVIAECLQQRFRELPTGPEARVQRPTHSQSRETSRRQYLCTPSGS